MTRKPDTRPGTAARAAGNAASTVGKAASTVGKAAGAVAAVESGAGPVERCGMKQSGMKQSVETGDER